MGRADDVEHCLASARTLLIMSWELLSLLLLFALLSLLLSLSLSSSSSSSSSLLSTVVGFYYYYYYCYQFFCFYFYLLLLLLLLYCYFLAAGQSGRRQVWHVGPAQVRHYTHQCRRPSLLARQACLPGRPDQGGTAQGAQPGCPLGLCHLQVSCCPLTLLCPLWL